MKKQLLIVFALVLFAPWATRAQDCTQTVPYTQDFESFTGTTYNASTGLEMPACWNGFSSSTSTTNVYMPRVVSGTGVYAYYHGSKGFAMTGGTNTSYGMNKYVLLPPMNQPLNQLQLSFWMCTESNGASYGTLIVGYVTSDDTSTFTPIQSYPSSAATQHSGNGAQGTGVGLDVEIVLSSVPANATRLAFKWEHSNTSYHTCCIDDILVSYPPTCPKVENLTATPSSDETVLSWTEVGSATLWEIVLTDAAGLTSTEYTSTNPHTLTGLTPNTPYSATVRAICGVGDTSLARSIDFRTACAVIAADSLPWSYGFEDATANAATATFNPCLGRHALGTTTNWPYPSATHHGTGAHSLYMYSTASVYSWLTLPLFEEDVDQLQVSFYAYRGTTASYGHWAVGVMTDPNDFTTFDTIASGQVSANSTWELIEVPLGSYTGNGNYIAILCPSGSAANYTYIDDLVVSYIPTCPRPTDVALINTTHDEATLSWSFPGSASAFTVYYDTLPNINPATTTTFEVATDTMVTLANLNQLTTYYYVVVADCGGGDFSLPSAEHSFATKRDCGNGLLNINDAVSYGTSSGYTYFTYNYNSSSYALGHTALLFTPEEMIDLGLEGPGTINSISVRAGATATVVPMRVYIGKTGLTAFNVASDTVGMLANMTLIFDDTLRTTAQEWLSIPLSVPFEYTPDSSLIIYFYRPALPTGNGTFYYTNTTPEYKTFYGYRSSTSTANLSFNKSYYRTDVKFDICYEQPTCPMARDPRVDSIYVDWANISWSGDENIPSYVIEYDTVNFVPGSNSAAFTAVAYDTTYLMSNLDTGATYYVYVRSDCGNDTSNFIGFTVTTLAALPAEVPFSCDFEGPLTNGWNFVNGTQTNHWMVGSATNNGGSKALYITNDGSANTYTVTSASYVFATRTFNLTDTGEYAYGFDWKAYGESSFDFIRVALVPSTTVLTAGDYCGFNNTSAVPDGGIALDGANRLNLQSNWQNQSGTFHLSTPGIYTWVFLWRNDPSGGTQPPAAIDNVVLMRNTCPAPSNLVVTHVTADSIIVSWQPGGEETSWSVSNGVNEYEVFDTTFAFDNLTANTDYTISVRAICGGADSSMADNVSAHTACSYASLPIFEDFDDVTGATTTSVAENNLPSCWSSYNVGTSSSYSGYPIVYSGTSYAHSGSQSMRFYNYITAGSYADQYGIMPITDPDVNPVNSLLLSFWMRSNTTSYNSWCVVGVMPNPTDASSFVPVDTLYTNSQTTYAYHEVNFSNYTGPHGCVTFLFPQPSTGYNYGYVDDVTLGPIPECPYVENIVAAEATTASITVAWTDTSSNLGWNIEFDTVEFVPGTDHMTAIHVTDTFCVLSGLAAATTYYVYVYPDCADGVFAVSAELATLTPPASIPYYCGFEGGGSNGWDLLNGSQTNYWTVGNAVNNGGSKALYITNDGSSNAYSTGSTTNVFASLNIDLNPGSYVCTFDWKAQGESSYDYIRTAIVPASTTLTPGDLSGFNNTSGVPAGGIAVDGANRLNLQSTWQTQISEFTIDSAGSYKLVFLWHNDVSGGTQPPAAIDNVSLALNTCPMVENVVANVGGTTIDLSWTAGGTETSWQVTVGGTSTVVTTPAYTATGLTNNTEYTVSIRPICAAGDTGFAVTEVYHTFCVDATLPYSENFDSYTTSTTAATGVQVPCWNYIMTGTSTAAYLPQVYYSSTNSHSGSYSLRLYGNSYTMLPPMPVSLDSLQLSFWDYTTAATYFLEVGVMEGNTFVPVQTITSPTSTHVEHTVYFSTYTGNSRIIAFRNYNSTATTGYSYHYIDDVAVSYRPTCTPVLDLHAIALGPDSITVDWTDQCISSQWEVTIGTTTATVTSHPVTFSSLTPNTDYTVSVRPVCSVGDTGEVVTATFHTRCNATTLPYTENFDAITTSTTAATGVHVDCWDYEMTGTYIAATYQPQIYYSSTYGHSGSYALRLYGNAITTLPEMPTSLDSLQLVFWDYTTSASYILEVGVVEGTTFIPIDTINTPTSTHMEHTVYFGNYTGTSRIIAFRNYNTTATTSYSYHYIDDVEVDYLPTCPPVLDLTSTASTTSSITLDWTDQISCGAWEVEYTGNGTTNTVAVTSHPTTLTGLTAATAYQVRVRPVCSASDTGNWCHPINAQTGCDLIIPPYYQNFDAVTASTYNTEGFLPPCWAAYSNGSSTLYEPHVVGSGSYWYADSANSLVMTSGSETYGDTKIVRLPQFAAPVNSLSMSFWMSTESNTNGYLQVGYMTSNDFSSFVAIDSIHADATTYHGSSSGTSANGIYDTVTFSAAPSTALYIAFKWVYTTSFYSCCIDNIEVSSTGSMLCPTPIIDTIVADETEITFNWHGGSANYEVAAMPGAWVEPTSSTPVTGLTTTLTGLTPGTQYSVGVRAVCAENVYSDWYVSTATTLEHPCIAPTNVNVTDIEYTEATVNWTPAEEGQNDFQVRLSHGGDTSVFTAEGTSYTLTGLVYGTDYTVAVRAVCGVGNESPWSASVPFQTAVCEGVSNVRVSNETVEGATVTWTGTAPAYEVAYGLPGVSQEDCTRQTVTGVTTYTITGLDDATTYVVYVRSVCESGIYSDWSNGQSFTTDVIGIDDVDNANISLYPNPASSTVTLTGIEGEAMVTVVDMNGRQVYTGNTANGSLTIDVSGMAQGAYFVRITGESVNAIRKLIVR